MSDSVKEYPAKIFSGKEEDFPDWKRYFVDRMIAKNFADWVLKDNLTRPNAEAAADIFDQKNLKFYSYVSLALDDTTARDMLAENATRNGFAAWKWLLGKYEKTDINTLDDLESKLKKLKLKDFADLKDYLTEVRAVARKIKSLFPAEMNDLKELRAILKGLSKEYHSYASQVYTKSPEGIDLKAVLENLLSIERYHKEMKEEEGDDVFAFAAHRKLPGKTNSSPPVRDWKPSYPKSKKHCDYCGKSGHVVDKCWKRKRDLARKGNPEQPLKFPGKKGDSAHLTLEDKPQAMVVTGTSVGARYDSDSDWEDSLFDFVATNVATGSHGLESVNVTTVDDASEVAVNLGSASADISGDSGHICLMTTTSAMRWVVDSAATSHMCHDHRAFNSLKCLYPGDYPPVEVANNEKVLVRGIGDIRMELIDTAGRHFKIVLPDVLFVPKLAHNLLSVRKICSHGHEVSFGAKGSRIHFAKGQVVDIPLISKLFVLEQNVQGEMDYIASVPDTDKALLLDAAGNQVLLENADTGVSAPGVTATPVTPVVEQQQRQTGSTLVVPSCEATLQEWHERTGHTDKGKLRKLAQSVNGMKVKKGKDTQCEACLAGKMVKIPFHSTERKTTQRGQLVHSDVSGPHRTPTFGNKHVYAIVFVDDFSRYIRVYTMAKKSDAIERFKLYCAEEGTPDALRIDGGGEYLGDFKKYCLEHHIKMEKTLPYTPEQNGVAERMWRTLFGMVRTVLFASGLGAEWWGLALEYAVYNRNRCLSTVLETTPFELYFNRKPNLANLKAFGSKVYVLNEDPKRGKLESRGLEGIFLGYGASTKTYVVYVLSTKKLKGTRNIVFLDKGNSKLPLTEVKIKPVKSNTYDTFDGVDVDSDSEEEEPEIPLVFNNQPAVVVENNPAPQVAPANVPPAVPVNPPVQDALRRSGRHKETSQTVLKLLEESTEPALRRKKAALNRAELALATEVVMNGDVLDTSDDTPQSFQEATANPANSAVWIPSMKDELASLDANNTWTLVPLPPGRKAVGGKWVYKIKRGADGSVARYKSRWVVQGFSQKEGIDYNETFSPVVKFTTIRIALALAAQLGLTLTQIDVSTAYLYAPLDCEIYMVQPTGFEKEAADGSPLVCKLNKSLYGLKQSGRNWNILLSTWLKEWGFSQSQADPCLFVYKAGDTRMLLFIYVDDMILACNNEELQRKLLTDMGNRFKITVVGDVSLLLGANISCKDGVIRLNQKRYIGDLLKRFGLENAHSALCPISKDISEIGDSKPYEDVTQYKSLVGSLIYAATFTRPDIAFAVGKAGQVFDRPTQQDWKKAIQILRYLKGTADYTLVYAHSDDAKLVGYSDSDWGSDSTDRKSISGFVFTLGDGVVSWGSKKQPCVALSSAEAEYVAGALAAQEAVFLRALLADMHWCQEGATVLYQDNQAAIILAGENMTNRRSKHIDIKFHFIRDCVAKGILACTYINTKKMLADCLTKAVSREVMSVACGAWFH